MNFSFTYIVYWLLFCSCNSASNSNRTLVNNDTTFINWNKVTLQSLARQIELSKDSTELNLYENRVQAFKAFVNIENEEHVNVNSIRYQFIKSVAENSKSENEFYLIEANRSGEQVEIRNYVIYPDVGGKADVDIYNFIGRKWVKSSAPGQVNFLPTDSLTSYFTSFRLGFNQDDVIISRFIDNKVAASEYYLYSTLSDSSNIKRILSLR